MPKRRGTRPDIVNRRRKVRQKTYRISVYGQVPVTKRQRIRPKSPRYSEKVRKKGYVRTVKYKEQRRWDFTGTKSELGMAMRKALMRRAAPRRKHLKIKASTYLRNPEKWEAEGELEYPTRRYG
jgi:hypothetical protein